MTPDPELVAVLCAGLEAQGFIETSTHGAWRRFAKFGRAGMEGEAYYVMPDGSVWHSAIRFTDPDFEVKGPILDRIFDAGAASEWWEADGVTAGKIERMAASRRVAFDADAALEELKGGSSASNVHG